MKAGNHLGGSYFDPCEMVIVLSRIVEIVFRT